MFINRYDIFKKAKHKLGNYISHIYQNSEHAESVLRIKCIKISCQMQVLLAYKEFRTTKTMYKV